MARDERPAVVYVDDERANLLVFQANFGRQFRVETFSSGAEALEAIPKLGEVGVLVSDQRMPGMSGVALLERARALLPDAQRMVITAYADLDAVVDAVNRGQVSRYFSKPWIREDLHAALEDALRIFTLQAQLREIEGRLRKHERLATIGQVSAGIAHELMNPVGYIGQNVEMLRGELAKVIGHLRARVPGPVDPEIEQSIRELPEILADIENGSRVIREVALGLRQQARGEDEQKRCDVAEVAGFAQRIARAEIRARARLTVEGPPLGVAIGPVALCQVLLNLLVNAAHAIDRPESGRITVTWQAEDGRARIEVADNGRGIPEALRERVFEPLFTTKPVGVGTGLGLAICRELVEAAKGELSLRSKEGEGATFTLRLPLA